MEPMMADTPVSVVQDAYDAFGRGDIPAVLATFAADIVWSSPDGTPWGGRYTGPDEVAGFFQKLVGGVDSVHLQVDRLVAAGPDRVLVEGADHYMIGGEAIDVPFAHVVVVRDGAIAGFTEYANVGAVTRAVSAVR